MLHNNICGQVVRSSAVLQPPPNVAPARPRAGKGGPYFKCFCKSYKVLFLNVAFPFLILYKYNIYQQVLKRTYNQSNVK